MNTMKYKLLTTILILTQISLLYADDPSWVYLRKAYNMKESGLYSEALILARKSKQLLIKEKLNAYYEEILELHTDKVGFELKRMVDQKEKELQIEDNYPEYHELVGDIFVLTDFLDEAIKEYKIALLQKDLFDYKDKEIEISYKLADVYQKKREFEMADIIYREILERFFITKNREFWDRIKNNIKADPTLSHVFRIYRIDGIVYLKALYEVGKRSSILQRHDDALYFLSIAAIVWMTYYDLIIKSEVYSFSYSSPADFINFMTKKSISEYKSNDYIVDQIMFYIGYAAQLKNETSIKNHYYNLAIKFSEGTKREIEIKKRINYFIINPAHKLSYQDIVN